MQRNEMIDRLEDTKQWDIVVAGGGATGAGIALDAALRGYRTLLLEKGDFGNGTSSRSTKLVHGGVRYLQQGNISLVLEALKERGILRRNALHLVRNQPFIVPNYDWWEGPFYGIGLKIYDALAGKEGFGRSELLSKKETIERLPTVETEGLNGGVIYYDGQFDDARLVINIVRTAADAGGAVLNYMPVIGLEKSDGIIRGIRASDLETGKEYTIRARVVINATGAWSDQLRLMDEAGLTAMIQPSLGVHIILDRSFLPGDTAIMVPRTDDGRVLFAIPWYDRVIVGTTDTPLERVTSEPVPSAEDRDFLLEHAARYLLKDPGKKDVMSIFAGIRPLVAEQEAGNTAALSRDHVIDISRSGLVTIAGGKWTTYRKMAEDTIDQALIVGELEPQPCRTVEHRIHGYFKDENSFGDLSFYGSDARKIDDLMRNFPELNRELVPGSSVRAGEVVWTARYEMVRTVTDFLSRRRRILILDAAKSIEMAAPVAALLAAELKKDTAWERQQTDDYRKLAKNYLP